MDSLTRYREAVAQVVAWAQRDLKTVWTIARLEGVDGSELRDAMTQGMKDVLEPYADIVSGVAADWYAEVRAAAGIAGLPPNAMVDAVDLAELDNIVRYEARLLWDRERDNMAHGKVVGKRVYKRDPEKMLNALQTSVDRVLQDRARWTITENAAHDSVEVLWRRVALPGACEWCKDLSSKGWQWPGRERAEVNTYHDHCTCVVEPVFERPDYVAAPEPVYSTESPF